MVEVVSAQIFPGNIRFQDLLFIPLFFFAVIPSYSQALPGTTSKEKKKIELLWADYWEPDENNSDVDKVVGHVALKHNDILMYCDSAYFNQKSNQVNAFGHIHIEQGDTLDLFGDYLFYDGIEEKANVDGNVELIDKETHLYTSSLKYDVANKIAYYDQKGRIINGENTLTSQLGNYYTDNKVFHFKDSVKIVNPDYIMTGDTMEYNTESETAYFMGPSELNGDSLYLYCERGWYDTKNDISRIWVNAIIDNRQQIIRADSLFYNDNTGFGEAFRNVVIDDTTNSVMVSGDYALYFKDPEKFLVTRRAMFVQYSDEDSLFLHADTITTVTLQVINPDTTTLSYRLIRAYYGCRVFSSDLQAKCDSLSYSYRDSVIRLYTEPVLWSEEHQLTADSMAIFTKKRQADRMELYNTPFIASQIDSVSYNQIKGRKLTGYFRDNKLYRIYIEGNSETIYYLDDDTGLLGVNAGKSSSIDIFVNDGKINEIIEHGNPDGKLDPPLLNLPEKMKLAGFTWQDSIRPRNKSDIFRKD